MRWQALSNYSSEFSVIECSVLTKAEKQQEKKRCIHWLFKWLDQRLLGKSKLGEHLQLIEIFGITFPWTDNVLGSFFFLFLFFFFLKGSFIDQAGAGLGPPRMTLNLLFLPSFPRAGVIGTRHHTWFMCAMNGMQSSCMLGKPSANRATSPVLGEKFDLLFSVPWVGWAQLVSDNCMFSWGSVSAAYISPYS